MDQSLGLRLELDFFAELAVISSSIFLSNSAIFFCRSFCCENDVGLIG